MNDTASNCGRARELEDALKKSRFEFGVSWTLVALP